MSIPTVTIRKIKRKKGFVYQLDYIIEGKRIREVVGSNKHVATLIQSERQNQIISGKYNLKNYNPKSISLEDLITQFLKSKKNLIREPSLVRYKNHLQNFSSYFYEYFPGACQNVTMIREIYIKECIDHLLEKEIHSPVTINGMVEKISSMFNYAVEQEYIFKNPAAKIKKVVIPEKNKTEFFSDDELNSIWESIDEFWKDHLMFLVHTGIRKGELINLEWKNVTHDENNPQITIISSGRWLTKTGKKRIIPLNRVAFDIIKKWQGKNQKYVFTGKRGDKIQPNDPYKALKSALEKLNLDGDIHKLRHTFAAKLVMKNESLFTVARLLGHSDTKTTELYAHLSPDYLKSAVQKLED